MVAFVEDEVGKIQYLLAVLDGLLMGGIVRLEINNCDIEQLHYSHAVTFEEHVISLVQERLPQGIALSLFLLSIVIPKKKVYQNI